MKPRKTFSWADRFSSAGSTDATHRPSDAGPYDLLRSTFERLLEAAAAHSDPVLESRAGLRCAQTGPQEVSADDDRTLGTLEPYLFLNCRNGKADGWRHIRSLRTLGSGSVQTDPLPNLGVYA